MVLMNNTIDAQSGSSAVATTVAGGYGFGSDSNQIVPHTIGLGPQGSLTVFDAYNSRLSQFAKGSTQAVIMTSGTGSDIGADGGNYRVQKFSIPTAQGSTAIGVTVAGGNGTGTALNQITPLEVAVDAAVNAYALDRGGLYYRYFEGSFNTLPDFSTLTPVKTGISPNVDINLRAP